MLRQPLEQGRVFISRAAYAVSYPADFMLLAAMNPCPCGYRTDPRHECTCTAQAVARYRAKLSGPLLDRIDLHVEVPAVSYEDNKEMQLLRKELQIKNPAKVSVTIYPNGGLTMIK